MSRKNGAIIQQASGDYRRLLELGLHRHLGYAQEYGFDYWPIFGEMRPTPNRHVYWEKPYLIRRAIEAGYTYIVAADSDVLITGTEDLRDAFPESGFGAVWHHMDVWGCPRAYDHFNIGVLYVRADRHSEYFVEEWIDQGDSDHYWHDQHAFHQLCHSDHYAGIVTEISRRWHSTPAFPAAHEEQIQVRAWHGCGSVEARQQAMEAYIRGRVL